MRVSGVDARKVAGVGRQRYVVRGLEGGDPVTFEGPPGLPLAPGADIVVLSRDGAPSGIQVAGQTVPLAPAPSDPAGAPALGPRHAAASAMAWLLLAAALLAAAYCLDAGTLDAGRWR